MLHRASAILPLTDFKSPSTLQWKPTCNDHPSTAKAEQIDALAEKVDAAQMSRWTKALAPRSFHVSFPNSS